MQEGSVGLDCTPSISCVYESVDCLQGNAARLLASTVSLDYHTSSSTEYLTGLDGVRVGVVHSMHEQHATESALRALHDACKFLEQQGAYIEHVHVPEHVENFFEVTEKCMLRGLRKNHLQDYIRSCLDSSSGVQGAPEASLKHDDCNASECMSLRSCKRQALRRSLKLPEVSKLTTSAPLQPFSCGPR